MSSLGVVNAPFGEVITAMITPFTATGELDLAGAARLAELLVEQGNTGLVLNGTTGESPTTSDQEKEALVRAVVGAVGERAKVLAGAGTNDTAHSVELARSMEKAGAHGLLVVSPYYNKPPQEGLYQHFTLIADSTDLPLMIYDIPGRTGVAVASETLVRLGEHERIVAVKDAKDDLAASSWVLSRSDLAYYSGTDALNLPLLSIGAVGVVSVVAHLVTARIKEMIRAYRSGEVDRAAAINRELVPVYQGLFRTQGAILTKAALNALGLPAGGVRPPLVPASEEQVKLLREDLAAAGVGI